MSKIWIVISVHCCVLYYTRWLTCIALEVNQMVFTRDTATMTQEIRFVFSLLSLVILLIEGFTEIQFCFFLS